VLRLDDRRARRWEERRREGLALDDEPGGGHPVHGLMPVEIEAILELHSKWGEVDRSHRKLAHRGSYERLVWVSPATVRRVLARYGRVLRYRPAPSASVKKPWPDWVEYRPNQVWGYDFSTFTAAGVQVIALLDLVSRKWIEKLICTVEATSVQVQVVFTRALEAEGLLDHALARSDGQALADPAQVTDQQPILLAVSDNGTQMTAIDTRQFMALMAIAAHYGRPGTPTDQAPIESFWGHIKLEFPQLLQITDPATLAIELDAIQREYNTVRLHAAIGYVTPDDEHSGRGEKIRQARRRGLARARRQRIAYHQKQKNHRRSRPPDDIA
jgi:putative transposase